MKLFLDFFPIVLFFIAFKVFDIYVATGVAIVGTIAQIAYIKHSTGKIEAMQWVSLAVIVVFGGATIIAHDETFIKWKPTILYWLMSVALLGGQLILKKNFLRKLMSAQLELPDHAWLVLLYSWSGFFTVMGFLNLYIAYQFDTDTWVNFKLFGGMGLMLVFVLVQAAYMSRFIKKDDETQ
ncbi:MAG: septation protein A [Betaproteobacteria bacterium]|jgi:intracellular septation protein|nr:septation protein A [Betaproteobacteria bacterium]NBT67000.1 septation protein A [Betaproteobacteria bacterium]